VCVCVCVCVVFHRLLCDDCLLYSSSPPDVFINVLFGDFEILTNKVYVSKPGVHSCQVMLVSRDTHTHTHTYTTLFFLSFVIFWTNTWPYISFLYVFSIS